MTDRTSDSNNWASAAQPPRHTWSRNALPAPAGRDRPPSWPQPSRPAPLPQPSAETPASAEPSSAPPGYSSRQQALPTKAVAPAAPPAPAVPPAPTAGGTQQSQIARPTPAQPLAGRSGCATVALIALFGAALLLLAIGGLLVGYAAIARDLPMPDELQERVSRFASTRIYDRHGGLINEVGDPDYGRRTVVPLDQISEYVKQATVATEDPNFYRHPGVDPIGIARAIYYALRERDLSGPGGSTITQQLVKLTFLTPEKTISRKIKEAILAAEISRRYSKDTILQIYLNEIHYGNLAYGIEAAAEMYFDKRARDLTLAEATLLAGLPQAPAYYDPYAHLWNADGAAGRAKRRQGIVLSSMVREGLITPAQADAAWNEPLRLKPLRQTYTSKHPHFAQYARNQVENAFGPELMAKGGLRIYTSLDPRIQALAEEEVQKQVRALAGQGATNAAVVVVRPQTGEVLAMVGSADFYSTTISGQINMALAPRQPGSALKPFTFLATFELPAAAPEADDPRKGQISAIEPPGYWTPATAIMDIRTEFPDGANPPYAPTNYDEKEHGLVSVRSALANSYNIPAVKALQHVGLERFKSLMARVGVTTLNRPDYGLSLTLGGGEVSLLELTGAYAALANGGLRSALSPIACVTDAEGRLIWRENMAEAVVECATAAKTSGAVRPLVTPAPVQAALNPQHVYLITSILADAKAREPMFGPAADLRLDDRPSAVKTGTSNDYRDAWTIGYTPDLAVGAWVGNADYKPMQKIAGARGAAPIWRNVLGRSLQGTAGRPFAEPPGIQRLNVCADSGALPSEACPAQRQEVFAAGQGPLPARYDLNQRVWVDRVTGRLATEYTPADRIEERALKLFPPKYRAWAEAHGYPQLAAEAPAYAFPPELKLISPPDGGQVLGMARIMGKVRLPEPLIWRVEYGVGPAPIGWGVLGGPNRGNLDGKLADWDTVQTVERHNVLDYSVRLAAYDPANLDYPVAVSNVAYVTAVNPTATPTATPTASPTPTSTPTRTATASPSPSATLRASPTATASASASATASPTGTAPPQGTASPSAQPPTGTPTPRNTATPTRVIGASPTATAAASATPTDARPAGGSP